MQRSQIKVSLRLWSLRHNDPSQTLDHREETISFMKKFSCLFLQISNPKIANMPTNFSLSIGNVIKLDYVREFERVI